MTNTLELELAITKSGLTKREIAKALKLSEQGFYNKINNTTEFKASEIYLLSKLLEIKEKETIFFDNNVDFKSLKQTDNPDDVA